LTGEFKSGGILPDNRVLVDTTIWIEHFRKRGFAVSPLLVDLRKQGRACICGVVLAELLQGSRSRKDSDLANSLTETCAMLPDSTETWKSAGELAAALRRKGLTIGLIDCFLAVLAVEHRAEILSLGNHFKHIAKHYPLELTQT